MIQPNGDLDRLREAFAADAAAGAADCPAPDRIWDAVNGLLDPAEVADLTEHVAACGACAEAWRIARDVAAEATAAAVISFPASPSVRRPSYAWPLLAAAATLVLAVAGWRLLRDTDPPVTPAPSAQATPKPEQTSASNVPAIEKAPVIMSASRALVFRSTTPGDTFLDDFGKAIEPYRNDNFPEAIARLEPLARQYPDADEPPFYLGVSLLMAGRRADAIAPLQRAARGRDEAIAAQARKYLTVAQAK